MIGAIGYSGYRFVLYPFTYHFSRFSAFKIAVPLVPLVPEDKK
jgi:hypothetical protein